MAFNINPDLAIFARLTPLIISALTVRFVARLKLLSELASLEEKPIGGGKLASVVTAAESAVSCISSRRHRARPATNERALLEFCCVRACGARHECCVVAGKEALRVTNESWNDEASGSREARRAVERGVERGDTRRGGDERGDTFSFLEAAKMSPLFSSR